MNCIPRLTIVLLSCTACGASSSGPAAPEDPSVYRIVYNIRPDPAQGAVAVRLDLAQGSALLREMRFHVPATIDDIDGDGDVALDNGVLRWLPPARGGSLEWTAIAIHRRNGNGHDAWLDANFGLFRAEDIVPRARTRTLKGASSETWMTFALPENWVAVSQYYDADGRIRVENRERRFDQPSGWIVMGRLGVRRETIAATRVAVAAPVGHAVRRMDILAMLNWTLPELAQLLPELPPRLTIVSAGDPMWRGGLSAPMSLFLHAERPLISENATSTLLHEVLHIALGLDSAHGYDWIVEGLAEYYSVDILHRSGSISDARLAEARSDLAAWSKQAQLLCAPVSSGETTALAVTIFARLDRELRDRSGGEVSLDDVTRALWSAGTDVTLQMLTEIAEGAAGVSLETLDLENLPGCRNIADQ